VVLARLLTQNARVSERMDEGFKLIARVIVEENERMRDVYYEPWRNNGRSL
jgi:hypothetical protein